VQDPIFLSVVERVFSSASAFIAVISVVVFAVAAVRSGAVKQIRFGSISIEGGITASEIAKIERPADAKEREISAAIKPFEIPALANYYNQALSRANISFWFSLIFASIGFGVIIFAFLSHNSSEISGTIIKVVSGTVIDAVAGLFFVQSTNAQKSMGDFFEKLRLDRLNAEAREMISEIENVERRDQLRAQLILKYSGIDRLLVGEETIRKAD
jgi:TRADD-N domain-containing protein